MTQILRKTKMKTWSNGSLTNVLWKIFTWSISKVLPEQEEEDTLKKGGSFLVTFRASFLPSSKSLPFSHHLCCFLDLHIILTLNYLHPKLRFLPTPLRKALETLWGFAAFHHPKFTFQCLNSSLPHPPPWPALTVHCCVWNLACIL